jgi:two-component sensor histidine kinase
MTPGHSARSDRVLVVDDTAPSRYVRAQALARAGYRVYEADSGKTALNAVASTKPDLVVLDVKLPDLNGIEVCRTIKAQRPDTLVLQTSAVFVAPADRIRGLETGADAYLIEPIEKDELLANVAALLRLRHSHPVDPVGHGRAALSPSDLLLRQMHHHTKNDFQMAVSLLSIQSQRSSDPALREALAQATGRLHAMAHVHELLYQSDTGTSIDCAELIRAVCNGLPIRVRPSISGVHLSFELEPFVCGRDRAVPVALITNEVVTNALKHAFPDGRGTIHVRFVREREGMVLTIRDDGAGARVAAGNGRLGFGKQLVSALANQLGDRDHLYAHGEGTEFRLVLAP